jgi:hypothetical protein
MNKDNRAAADAGNSAAKTRAEAVSEGGGVKLTSLAGMLFHHKDKKKGEGALFHIWFEDKLGYDITFPDTSNTRYQSHCEAAGVLLTHKSLFLGYLEHTVDYLQMHDMAMHMAQKSLAMHKNLEGTNLQFSL